jgi:hypothetical protein
MDKLEGTIRKEDELLYKVIKRLEFTRYGQLEGIFYEIRFLDSGFPGIVVDSVIEKSKEATKEDLDQFYKLQEKESAYEKTKEFTINGF